MSGGYRSRRAGKTRDPIQMRLAEGALLVSVAVVVATLLSWPSTGLWDSPNFRLFNTVVSFGVISPSNFQYLLVSAVNLILFSIFVFKWAASSVSLKPLASEDFSQLACSRSLEHRRSDRML